MKLFLMLALLMLTAMVSIATYNDSLQGSQTAAPEAEGVALNLTASGDLPGMTKVKLQRDGQNVTGGSFRITVLPQNADASSSERGELVGTISGGTVTLNTEGTLSAASGVQFTIQSGTGEFASVTSGSGTISISANSENPSQLSGTLVLNF
jgi:outer membrane lipoprotein SlyB